jgi:cytoskeleton protein RodZ
MSNPIVSTPSIAPPVNEANHLARLPTDSQPDELGQALAAVADENQLNLPEIAPPAYQLPTLNSIRVQQGRTVEQAASALRLSVNQINAMESQQWQALPGSAYIKGFLRNYTKYLGVDTAPYIEQYENTGMLPSPQIANSNVSASGAAGNVVSQHGAGSNAAAKLSPAALAVKHSTDKPTVLKDDPAALSSFNQAAQSTPSRGLMGVVMGLLALTAAFLMYWERALWLPTVQPVLTGAQAWFNTIVGSATTGEANNGLARSSTSAAPATASVNGVLAPIVSAPAASPVSDSPASSASTTNTAITTNPPNASSIQAPVSPVIDGNSRVGMPQALSALPATARVIDVSTDKAVWLELRDATGAVIDSGMKPAGSRYQVEGKAPISAIIGAADAVTIQVNGKPIDIISAAAGNVARVTIQ